ncbi:MAG: serine hydrolase [Armatimonadota bacterium]
MRTAGNSQIIWPAHDWTVARPEQMGIKAADLKRLADAIGGNGCMVVRGQLVASWGKWQQRADVASAAKPIYAHLLFKALENGLITDLDTPVVKWQPRLGSINSQLGNKDAKITWRHLANQTSCYGLKEQPGTAFAYNDYSMAMFLDTLLNGVYKAPMGQYDSRVLNTMIVNPLGLQDKPTLLAFGEKDRPGRLAISPRDYARFGYLYLHEGRWGNKQIISQGILQMALHNPLPLTIPRTTGIEAEMIPGQRSIGSTTIPDNQVDHDGSYSWFWWVNGINHNKQRNWPGLPHDAFAALGHWGTEGLLVLPSHDTIISWNQSRLEPGATAPEAAEILMQAISPLSPRAGFLQADPDSAAWMSHGGPDTSIICGPGDPEGFLYRGILKPDGTRDGDQMALIHKMAGTGANCIYMIAIRSHGGDGDPTQNPYINHDPSRELNTKLLDQWESWFTEMDKLGIIIYLFVYDDSARVWNTGNLVGPAEEKLFRQLVSKFKHHQKLVWCLAEEYQEALSVPRAKKLAAIIRKEDPIHSIAVHKLHGATFKEFIGDPSINQYAVQYNTNSETELHNALISCWREAKGRYHINMSECANFGNREVARSKIWACVLAGASAMVIDMDIEHTPIEQLTDCGHVVSFMESFNAVGLNPADERRSQGTTYAMAASDGRYLLYGKKHQRRLGLLGVSGGLYDLVWFDCVTGIWSVQPNVKTAGSTASWAVPAIIGDEAVLYARLLR